MAAPHSNVSLRRTPFVAVGLACALALSLGSCGGKSNVTTITTDPLGRIGNLVWCDVDGDGVQDPGEPGIEGIAIRLTAGPGAPRRTVSAANGAYAFDKLSAGTYTVDFDPSSVPDGLAPTTCTDGPDNGANSDCSPIEVTLPSLPTAAETNEFIDFGFRGAGVIGDLVWDDIDADGVRGDDEPGLVDIRVVLRSPSGATLAETRTDADGRYAFERLCKGTYVVAVDEDTLPDCYVSSPLDRDSVGNPATVELPTHTAEDLAVDFGFHFSPGRGVIGDFVWLDRNCDGCQDPGEPGIDGVRILLLDRTGRLLADAVTGPDAFGMHGHYEFENLKAGTYIVAFVSRTLPPRFEPTARDACDDDTIDSDGNHAVVVLDTNEKADRTVDFGFCVDCRGVIGDRVWCDRDCDGIQDPDEDGIGGIEVFLDDADGDQIATTSTDEVGRYAFEGLCAGRYVVRITVPPGFDQSPPNRGSDRANDSNGSPARVVLETDESVDSTIDFGLCGGGGVIGDLVWRDLDVDGCKKIREPGLPGIRIVLRDAAGRFLCDTRTDDDGLYEFSCLRAGTYTVEFDPESVPVGLEPTRVDACDDDERDSDPSPVTVVLPSDDTVDPTIDFGFRPVFPRCEGCIGDFVWNDRDRDGIQDGDDDDDDDDGGSFGDDDDDGEPGIPGAVVILRDAQGGVLGMQTTDEHGFYTFTDLCQGRYRVEVDPESLPRGFVASPCNVGNDDTIDNDCSPAHVELPTNRTCDDTVDFGYHEGECDLHIGDFVWHDRNCNGLQDRDEIGLEGVKVVLRNVADGRVLGFKFTDDDGHYVFRGLCPGRYRVEIDPRTLPPRTVPGPCDVGNDDTIDNDCSPVEVELPGPFPGFGDSIDFGYIVHGDPPDEEGCSPGFWKQPQHFDDWPPAFRPETPFGEVFEDAFPGKTLLQVLKQGGGGLRALGRHTVAALLNAESTRVDYGVSTDRVIDLFDDVFPATRAEYKALKNFFERRNNRGCDL